MSDIFKKPYLDQTPVYFPYTVEKLCEGPIFPSIVFDGGAFFFANDALGTVNGDELLEKIMSGEIFSYWYREGEFDWLGAFKDFRPIGYTSEWEGHIWINRLYVLLPLAQAYAKTRDVKFLNAWLAILKDFTRVNPYTRYEDKPVDLVWRDMQVTWRTLNLLYSIFLFQGTDDLSREDWEFIYTCVKTHVDHMTDEGERYLEITEPDNHRLQIGTALILYGALFPEMFDQEKLLRIGKGLVEINMKKSIFDDGCNNEDSMSYSHFIARLYLEAELVLEKNGFETVEGCKESIQKQYEFLYKFSTRQGKTVQFGDSYVFDAEKDVEFINSFYPLTFKREKKTELFASSRMAVLRNARFEVFIDAMDMTEWHQHFGRPQFIVFCDGLPMVVDSGSVNYDRGYFRRRLNSEKGHSVIYSPSIPLTRQPSNETLAVEDFKDLEDEKLLTVSNTVTGSDGTSYKWLRTFRLFEDRLEIIDTVNASKPLNFVSQLFLPECRIGYAPAIEPENQTELLLRFGSFMERIKTDTVFETQYTPCVDTANRMNYAQLLIRKFNASDFTERTVITFERIREGNNYLIGKIN